MQAAIQFPFAISGSYAVHFRNAEGSGCNFAFLALSVQFVGFWFGGMLSPEILTLLAFEALTLFVIFKIAKSKELVLVFPWSGVVFNCLLLVCLIIFGTQNMLPWLVAIFLSRLVFCFLILAYLRFQNSKVSDVNDTALGQDDAPNNVPSSRRFWIVFFRQFVFINARFLVPEQFLAIVAIAGRIAQNAFVFILYPIFLFGDVASIGLALAYGAAFGVVTGGAVWLVSAELVPSLIMSVLVASLVVFEVKSGGPKR
ncbi:hypothetical protein L0664_00130 [Octadecabacter sp. G9-8]|uniref:Uncharacterized protein n=2 Tax=Octadecabacter dasysiphoniae TaxID=2909341 RepID=A0ABS9CSU0_9RHOB|nr:hypothetical protein [Octadecabacter dasysiphoniae]